MSVNNLEEQNEIEDDDDVRRKKELIEFIDDFLNSEEFTHITSKTSEPTKPIRRRFYCRCKECWIQTEVVMTRSALVRKRQELYRLQLQFERLLKIRNIKRIRLIQDVGIHIIREKIADAKKAYWCHKRERDLVTKKKRQGILEDLKDLYGIDLQFIGTTSPHVTKVLAYRKIKRTNDMLRKQRTVSIVKHILRDFSEKKVIESEPIKSRIEHKRDELDVSQVLPRSRENDEDQFDENIYQYRPVSSPNKLREEESLPEEQKEAEVNPLLPYVPITNTRKRFLVNDNVPNAIELLEDLSKLPRKYKERMCYDYCKNVVDGKEYEKEPFFRTSPACITFHNFKNGKVYKRKVRIYNGGTVAKKCMFNMFKVDDVVHDQFEAEAVGAHAVLPGMHFEMHITFSPEEVFDVAKGRAIFVTYTAESQTFLQFSCFIACIPVPTSICVTPNTINFESKPIWEARKSPTFKNLTLQNLSDKDCLLVISKAKCLEDLHGADLMESLEENTGSLEVAAESCAEYGVDDYLQNIINVGANNDSAFTFSTPYLRLSAKSKAIVKVYFQNVDYVGSYFETYFITMLEEKPTDIKCHGVYEITVTAEISGAFIEVDPFTIDFRICVYNSVYCLPFQITNTASIPHLLGIQFPSSLKKYFWSDAREIMIQPGAVNTYHLKFIPRREITQCTRYYDSATHILEFPMCIKLLSKKFSTVPPCKVVVVAILTESCGLALSCSDTRYTTYYNDLCNMNECTCETNAQYVIDLGKCTTAETVYTELQLQNTSYVPQTFGFINLPPYLQIMPNFGFGELSPLETKSLTLFFNPEIVDIPGYDMECEYADMLLSHTIKVDTVKNLGGLGVIKKKFTYALIKKLLVIVEKEMNTTESDLIKDMRKLTCFLRTNDLKLLFEDTADEASTTSSEHNSLVQEFVSISGSAFSDQSYTDRMILEIPCPSLESIEEEEQLQLVIKNNKLVVKGTVVNSLCDLSYQHVQFPDTPCGSYSIMPIHLRARASIEDVKCVCSFGKRHTKCKNHLNYAANFEIITDSRQFNVEPTCGSLRAGQSIKLNIIVRPQMKKSLVMETARRLKKEEILRSKLEQWLIQQSKSQGKGDKKKETVHPVASFGVTDEEIFIVHSDLYYAEMETYKFLEPFTIKAKFCCNINYSSNDFHREQEQLYFITTCNIIRPSFVHNLKCQRIDFGQVPVGRSTRQIIEIENISEDSIYPTVTHLSPTGFFTIPHMIHLELPPQHVLHLPLTCNPDVVKEALEYFEIRASSTIYSFVASADGVKPEFTITPDFLVCRLEAKLGKFAECALEIKNSSVAPISFNFVKVCEIEGEVHKPEEPVTKDKKAQPKKVKVQKFSDTLTDEELNYIPSFEKKSGESFFKLVGLNESDSLEVNANSKVVVKIVFGDPVKPAPLPKNLKPEKPKLDKKLAAGPKKYYVIKYNVMMSKSRFIKDIILIGTYD